MSCNTPQRFCAWRNADYRMEWAIRSAQAPFDLSGWHGLKLALRLRSGGAVVLAVQQDATSFKRLEILEAAAGRVLVQVAAADWAALPSGVDTVTLTGELAGYDPAGVWRVIKAIEFEIHRGVGEP